MELWLDHQKTAIWLKDGKYQLVIEREIIEASGGFYVARLSLEQYGRIDNPNCIGDILNTERYKANKAIFLPSLTYWLRIHVAYLEVHLSHSTVLHSLSCHHYLYPLT